MNLIKSFTNLLSSYLRISYKQKNIDKNIFFYNININLNLWVKQFIQEIQPSTRLQELQEKTSEFIIKTHIKLPMLSRVWLSLKLNNILKTSLLTEDASHIWNILVESVELDKPLNSEKLWEDGPKNQSESFSD